ncbi:poly [ADP-ribose] polymerase 1-like [Tubulanus polymorphus]|uniref:poly [ADP-ribose] polymerase 1-like n=1 Tax=Tubulanus polymorphus TaxID=672921 RepID=UPI003DA67FA8
MSAHDDLPFKAEYAKSGRASCKSCKTSISKDSLRLAVMVQSPAFDGKIPNWYHEKCFWNRARVKAFTDIHGFDSLRWDDQKKIKDKLGLNSGSGDSASSESNAYKDYKVEYAKTGQSKCRGCDDKIGKSLVRISKKEYTSFRAQMYGPADEWHHVDCFVNKRDELEFWSSMDVTLIPGFHVLKKEDRDELVEKIGKGDPKKRKSESSKTEPASKKMKTEDVKIEAALKKQSELLWKTRDDLQKTVSNNALKGLLEYNKQELPAGESRLLDRVSDGMVFGALKPCPECKGQLVYSSTGGYVCTGNISEWTKCMYVTKTPQKTQFKIPTEYKDVDCLKKYKYVKRDRIFPKETAMSSTSTGPISSASDPTQSAARPDKPLYNLKFVLCGKFSKPSGELKKSIQDLGAKITSKVTKDIAAVISNKDEIAAMSTQIASAQKLDIQIVDEEFITAVVKGGCVELIKKHNISSWGADPASRIGDALETPNTKSVGKSFASAKSKSADAHFTKHLPSKVKMMVKGGAAVDPDSGLMDKAHILQDRGGDPMSVVLGMVDLVKGTNSYYKLQLLESDKGARYWVFRSWGRVGTTIGNNKLQAFNSNKNEAIRDFQSLYLDKTGNDWSDRKNFQKQPNKFYPLELDFGQDDEDELESVSAAKSNSKLPKPVQKLIELIFDIETMKKAMLEFEIDLKKMPLGKLSKNQIEKAYKILTELNKLVEGGGTTTKFLDASNRFYTLIPHDFGMNKPPLLDTADVIKAKTEMLDNLLEIEVAYSLLKGGNKGKDPIDAHYAQLKTDMEVMDQKSDEFKRLVEYVKNTHATTHSGYKLDVKQIFKVEREGETARYKPFKQLDNRQLLWHGSRITNYCGILSQGLRIAPPEAPVTGYMFGKGVYFADMVSKSANYCHASRSNPTALLMLCEVALGNMYEKKQSEFITKLPKGKHSTKGLGRTAPDSSQSYTTDDGVVIPMGKGVDSKVDGSSLLYNEFIVYDVSQINIKYLLQTEFIWNC